ncbi:hypothetical protein CDAR_238231 [Caerostris darwini]|uniref:Uncharacterized protein n=1 Tax=Caerostris darwini TaxID=1538125 RepID=A0AAV4TK33_9ARAC|nr:hypothetical protein CDAR_238231 [Caerostris darwini]
MDKRHKGFLISVQIIPSNVIQETVPILPSSSPHPSIQSYIYPCSQPRDGDLSTDFAGEEGWGWVKRNRGAITQARVPGSAPFNDDPNGKTVGGATSRREGQKKKYLYSNIDGPSSP